MFRGVIVIGLVLWAIAAAACVAADQPKYEPVPAWVKPIPLPTASPAPGGGSVQYLLSVQQANYSADGDKFFTEFAAKATAPQALANLGSISELWNPDTDTLIIHKVHIIRGGQTIDVLAGGKTFTVLRRESNLELAMLDGTLTATIQPEGLRVGDILDVAVTLERRDPVVQGRSEGVLRFVSVGVVGRAYFRSIWPVGKTMRWRTTEGLGAPTLTRAAGENELIFDLSNASVPRPPNGAPARFNDLGRLEATQFTGWAEVSSLMAPLYAKASALAPGSAVLAEAAKIKAGATTPKARAAAALHLVEDQTRYLFLGMNLGGYIPADADVTWSRRFGDCKGKTALLLALLHALDIDAEPVLVSTGGGDGLDEQLPMLSYFDHVMVRAIIGGKVYWLDGTRSGDRGLDDLEIPNFGWVLPVQRADGRLERLNPPPLTEPAFDNTMQLDARAGLDKPAPAHLVRVLRGDTGIAMNLLLGGLNQTDAERYLREFWRNELPWIDIAKVGFAYDGEPGAMMLSMDGSATMNWQHDGEARDFDIADSALGWDTSFKRDPGPHQDAPFAVVYPMYKRWTVVIQLPNAGVGFTLLSADDTDATVAGVEFSRKSVLKNGVVTMEAAERSLAPEFPAIEADQAAVELRKLAEHDVDVRAGAGYQATLSSDSAVADKTPSNAAEFSIRGGQRLRKGDYDGAIADFDQAARLAPGVSRYIYDRGVAYFEKGQEDLALADFNQALTLKPTDGLALLARGQVYLDKGDDEHAGKDFDQAIRLSSGDPKVVTRAAGAYEHAGRFPAALRLYDSLLAQPSPSELSSGLLNNRCWLRVEWGRQLDLAKADCDAAIIADPRNAAALDSRGLLNFRLKRFDQSIADYDAALGLRPHNAASFFGRGLAKLRIGRRVEAATDLAAAKAIDPGIEARFATYGLKP